MGRNHETSRFDKPESRVLVTDREYIVSQWLGSTLGRGPKAMRGMQAGHTGDEPGFESESDDGAGEGVRLGVELPRKGNPVDCWWLEKGVAGPENDQSASRALVGLA